MKNYEALTQLDDYLNGTRFFELESFIAIVDGAEKPGELITTIDTNRPPGLLHFLLTKITTDNYEQIKTFIEKHSANINPNIADGDNKTPLNVVTEKGYEDLAQLMRSPGKFAAEEDAYLYLNSNPDLSTFIPASEDATLVRPASQKAVVQNNFVDGIVLVTAFATDSVFNYLLDKDPDFLEGKWEDSNFNKNNVLRAITTRSDLVTNNGTIGAHLDFEGTLYKDSFVDRPHTHWYWNQLCHANSGGNWESSLIAVLEPLSAFHNVEAIVPYDTCIMGPHHLSAQSAILVPHEVVEGLRTRLKSNGESYKGEIIGYDSLTQDLRTAINETIRTKYPNALKLLNKDGVDTSCQVVSENKTLNGYNFSSGYFEQLDMVTKDMKRESLMTGSNKIHLQGYAEYARGRHVGLHSVSLTDIERDPIFQKLKKVSEKPTLISNADNMKHLIGLHGSKKIEQLFVVHAFKTYCRLKADLSVETGAHAFADYLLKKAIIADFRAYHYQQASQGAAPLTEEALRTMVDKSFNNLVNILKERDSLSDFLNEYRQEMKSVYNLYATLGITQAFKIRGVTSLLEREPPNLSERMEQELSIQEGGIDMTDDDTDPTHIVVDGSH